MKWDDSITLIVSSQEAVAVSTLILASGASGHRPEPVESMRKKLRAGLDRRMQDLEEEEAEFNILLLEYQRSRT